MNIRIIALFIILLTVASCAGSDIFPDIGTNLSSPMEMQIDSASNRLYLVNSNNKVLYRNGSFQVYDISTPTAPALLSNGTAKLDNFSGQVYLDLINNYAYLTNRKSESNQDIEDHIVMINVNEGSASFLSAESFADGSNPFGITYNAADANLYVAAQQSALAYFALGSPGNISTINLSNLNLSTGDTLVSSNFTEVAIIGSQAFLSRSNGGLLVVDLNEGNADYFVNDFLSPRGITTDGTNIYFASVDLNSDTITPTLYSIDPAAFPVRSGNADVTVKSREDAGVVLNSVQVGNEPQEVIFSTNYFFVTNFNDGTVSVINRADMTKNTDITVGSEPFGMAVYSPGGADTHLYVSNMASNSISIIDLTTLSVVATYN